jgi:hypothetical protein
LKGLHLDMAALGARTGRASFGNVPEQLFTFVNIAIITKIDID